MGKHKRTGSMIANDLEATIDAWILRTQHDDDQLKMWVHEGLAKQMTAACLTVLDACRDSQNFAREQEKP